MTECREIHNLINECLTHANEWAAHDSSDFRALVLWLLYGYKVIIAYHDAELEYQLNGEKINYPCTTKYTRVSQNRFYYSYSKDPKRVRRVMCGRMHLQMHQRIGAWEPFGGNQSKCFLWIFCI